MEYIGLVLSVTILALSWYWVGWLVLVFLSWLDGDSVADLIAGTDQPGSRTATHAMALFWPVTCVAYAFYALVERSEL